jgi:cytochrome c oxidase assembly factor CtaG
VFLHVGGPQPTSVWTAWPAVPLVQVGLFLATAMYVIGWRRLVRLPSSRRSLLPKWRVWCYFGGIGALTLALASPIDSYSNWLFFVHMIQHLLLLLIAPPLLWLGAPMLPMLWALPRDARKVVGRLIGPGGWLARVGGFLTQSMTAAGAFALTMALWHLPQFYDKAQGRTLIHDLEHLMFFVTSLLYWWPVIHPGGGRRRLSYGAALPYLLPPFVEGMVIGALITFSGRPIYQTYVGLTPTWGLSTLDDQQIGGLIMWIPGGMLFLIPLIGLLSMVFRQEEQRAQALAHHRSRKVA